MYGKKNVKINIKMDLFWDNPLKKRDSNKMKDKKMHKNKFKQTMQPQRG